MDKSQDIKRFRKLLGESANKLTDEEITRIMKIQYQLADLMFDKWLKEKNKI